MAQKLSVVSYFKSHLGLHLWLFVPEFEGGPISGLWSTKKFIFLGGIMLKIPFCSAIEGHGEFVPKKLTNLNEPNFSQLSLINGSLKWKLDLVRKLCKKAGECNGFFEKQQFWVVILISNLTLLKPQALLCLITWEQSYFYELETPL